MLKYAFWVFNLGTSFGESPALKRRINYSNQIAFFLFLLSLLLEVAYLILYPFNAEAFAILIGGILSLFTILINKAGFVKFSRYWLSISISLSLLITSLYAKSQNIDALNHEYDYFNYRIMIIAVSILPAILFTIDEVLPMLFCFLVSVLIIIFFDPIHLLFGLEFKSAINQGSHYYFSNVIIILSYILILGLVTLLKSASEKNEIINEKLIAKSVNSKERLIRYQYAILNAAKEYRKLEGDEVKLYKLMCTTLSKKLVVNRVSIWELGDDDMTLTRKYLFEKDGSTDEQVHLYQKDFPKYFYALKNKPFIIADQARFHVDTKEFKDSYLVPLDIYSMLDCPIVFNDKIIGVICCENQHNTKIWNPEDGIFIQSLADFISMYKQSEEIKRLLSSLQQKNNELARQSGEIRSINENLESMVKKRTLDLEERNKKLVEYGFINSHLVRAPLARILGLTDLISREINIKDHYLIDLLVNSSRELDIVLTRITNVLSENHNLTVDLLNKKIEQSHDAENKI